MWAAFLFCVFLFAPLRAQAAAWTLPEDSWQVITTLLYSNADRGYDGRGDPATPKLFQRALLQTDAEYGWNNALTLFLRSENAYAYDHDPGTPPVHAKQDNAFEGGLRYLLASGLGIIADDDVLSLEVSARSAGAFNFAVSANANAAGYDGGFRLLYGAGFRWSGHDGFVNVEMGYRFVSAPRPDQMPIDVTTGLWLNPDWMVMLQSFNLTSGAATPPYSYFRIHKLELSAVWRFVPGWALQAGGFVSPTGQNALVERGLLLSVWSDF
jgi:hypothetical protein